MLSGCTPLEKESVSTPTVKKVTTPQPTQTPILSPTPTPTLIPHEGPVKIFGYVKDENGNPVKITIAIDAFGLGDQGWVKTDENGYYEMEVQNSVEYIVSVNPDAVLQTGKYSIPSGYMPQKRLVVRNGGEAKVDFVVQDSGTIWLKTYDANGKEMTMQDFIDSSKIGAYPVGTFPYGESIQNQYDSFPLYWGWIENSNKNIPCLMLPPGEPADIWMVWRLPEVGTTFLHADNDGKGFSVNKGDVIPINLVYEFAITEYIDALNKYQLLIDQGYSFSDDISSLLSSADQNFSKAEISQEQGLEEDSAKTSYLVLTAAIKAKEQIVLEQANQDIEKYRKGEATLVIADDRGNTLSSAAVDYKQASHDFIFSVGWPSPYQYESLREAGIENSFFEAWWGEVETSDGVYNFPDSQLNEQQKAGLDYVMETGLWLSPNYPPAIPKFAAGMSPAELSSQVYQYSYDYVTHFKNKIKIYGVYLEPDLSQAYQYSLVEFVDIVRSSNLGVKDADASLPTHIMIAHPIFKSILMGDVNYNVTYDQFGNMLPGVLSFPSPASSGYEFLQESREAGVNYDVIGLEYAFGAPYPSIDLGIFENTINFYRTLSKKIFISEILYPTMEEYPEIDKWWEGYGGWHEGFTDKTQADWAALTLTIAFGNPDVIGYQWGNTNDGPADYYLNGTGLFHKDRTTPRLSLNVISDLIKSWTTTGSSITDDSGSLTFRGFGGDYDLTITTEDGHVYRASAHVTEQQNNTVYLIVDTTAPIINSADIQPTVVKNGEEVVIKVDLGEAGLNVTCNVSSLDSTQIEQVVLEQNTGDLYEGTFLINPLNGLPNGKKYITLFVEDNGGNISTSTLEIELSNPPPVRDEVSPDDDFRAGIVDQNKWRTNTSTEGSISQDGKLVFSTSSGRPMSIARVDSTWQLKGDFDIQVDFRIGEGWSLPAKEHLDGAFLGVNIDGQEQHITRLRSGGEDVLFAWGTREGGIVYGKTPSDSLNGKYRLIRIGSTLFFLYDIGKGWVVLTNAEVSISPAQVYMGNGSINASQAFTTYFDNFQINSGLTNYH